jgi:amino acid adenylation domain-containing protein
MAYLLHHLLTETAYRLSDKEAIRFEDQGLSYEQLDSLTNQVARMLISTGLRRGDRVGIYLHKSLASVISLFGILKAGGVYVPLDPKAPTKRLAYITRNCMIKTLLTSGQKLATLGDVFSEGTPLQTLILTDDVSPGDDDAIPRTIQLIPWSEVCTGDDRRVPDRGNIETDLAYILYTSGSTGDPKGVMISHRTIFTFINWCYETFQMTQHDRVTSHAPLHFDLSTFDIFVTIKAGGTVILVPEEYSTFPIQLADLIQNERITVTYLVPSILSLMVNYGKLDGHDFSALRTILFAGEVFPKKYLRRLVASIPHADYYNLYGPTETNVCTYYQVQASDLESGQDQPLPIGVACGNTEVFAVDDQGQRVSQPGMEAELWVRGSCVAQGYWGDQKKTAKGFVTNPFQTHFDEVVYRTGDVVKLSEDGVNWLFIGRKDHMIKSRGYRIELGEIETVLYRHQDVKEAAVVAVPDDLIGNRLKAFIVPLEENGLLSEEIKSYCSQHLPRYMIPEAIEFREALPKTSTGKINRPQLVRSS